MTYFPLKKFHDFVAPGDHGYVNSPDGFQPPKYRDAGRRWILRSKGAQDAPDFISPEKTKYHKVSGRFTWQSPVDIAAFGGNAQAFPPS